MWGLFLVSDGMWAKDKDGLTPVWCLDSAGIKPLPVGVSLHPDPEALEGAGPCLWWDDGGRFFSFAGEKMCLDAPLAQLEQKPRFAPEGKRLFIDTRGGDTVLEGVEQ